MSNWPLPNKPLIAELTASGPSVPELRSLSPVTIPALLSDPEFVIDSLFGENQLLCIGRTSREFATRPRNEWLGQLGDMQFLVPTSMRAVWGLTKKGYWSQHTLQNTGPREYLVVEFDTGDSEHQTALLYHLGALAPLVLAVHSGGKSIHGWFSCRGADDRQLESFFRYAVSLGADDATWSRSQFVRMPNGVRENGRRQDVLFLNPSRKEQ